MRRAVSVSASWALRYTVAMAATLTVFVALVHAFAAQRSERAVELVARTQASELLAQLAVQARERSNASFEAWCAQEVASRVAQSDAELGLGIALLGYDGRVRHAAGSLREAKRPLPEAVRIGQESLAVASGRIRAPDSFVVASATAPGGYLQVAVGTRHWAEGLAKLRNLMIAALPIMLLLCGVSGWLLARRSLASVDEITRFAEHVSSASLSDVIPTRGTGDELDRLAHTLNAMLARIHDGMAQMQRFNANAAHELRTPLHRLGGQIDAALSRPRDAEAYRAALLELQEETRALSGAVNALLRLSQVEAGLDPAHTQPVEIAKLLRTQVEFFAPLASERGIALELEEPLPALVVRGDAAWLERLFSNLTDNAIKYSERGDGVRIAAREQAGRALITVADSGPGIAPDELPVLFERFARGAGREDRSGFGLGLALAAEIARAHEGTIEVESELGRGSRFTVALPLFAAPRGEPRPALARRPSRSHQGVLGRSHAGALRRR
jgi:heavy metal sensor kinase